MSCFLFLCKKSNFPLRWKVVRTLFLHFLFLTTSIFLSAQVEFVVKNGEVPCNGAFSTELYVNNFTALNNLTFTIEYDSDRVSYSGFQDLFPSGTVTTIPAPGIISVFWASGGPAVTIGNGETVLLLEFDHIGNCDEPFIIHIVDEPTPVIAGGPSGEVEALIFGAVFLVEDDCQIEVDAGEDQFVCDEGDMVDLNGDVSGDIYDFFWEPENLVSNPFSLSTSATVPDNPTIFTLIGRSESHNIVYNTHLDFGYAGFYSDYEYDEEDISAGNAFAVANSPDIVFSNFPLCSDHTGNNGNMIIVNGVNAPPQNVWCQYIEVQEGIEYQLDAYINTLTSGFLPQAELQFSIDGDFVGDIFDPPAIPCFSGWVQMNANWIAPADGMITFCIYNHQGNVSPVGNGFIVDDIAMYPICEVEDEVTVEIQEPAEIFLEEKICWNEEPFEVNGQFFSESGSYEILIERPGQCDSTVHLELEVIELEILVDNPGLINCFETLINLDASFSSMGDDIEFIWSTPNGNIISGQGTPIIEVDAGGNYFLQLVYDDGDIVCQTDELPFIVEEDTDTPEVSIRCQEVIDCEASEIELEAVVEPAGTYGYQWSASAGGNIVGPDFEAVVTVDAAGFYQLVVTNFSNGCSDTAFFEVGLSADFPVADAGGDRVWNCNDSLIVLDGSQSEQGADISYLWTTSDGIITGPDDEDFLQILSPGIYVLEVTNTENGCIASDTVRVSLPANLPTLVQLGDSLINCNNTVGFIGFSLNPDSLPGFFSWTTLEGEIISSPDSAFIEVAAGGWYVAEVFFSDNGCTIRDSILVAENFQLPFVDAGIDTVLGCSPPSIVLDGSNSDTSEHLMIEWTGGNILTGENSFFPTIDQAATYYLTVTDTLNGCAATDSVRVMPSDDLPQISFEGSLLISCSDSSTVIQAVVSPDNFTPVFDWTSSDVDFDLLPDSSAIRVYSGGTITLNVIFQENQCSATDMLFVEEDTVRPIIQFLTSDSLYCGNEEVLIELSADTTQDLSYSWAGPPGGIVSGENSPDPLVREEGWYIVTITNEFSACFSTDSIYINSRFDLPAFEIEQTGQLDCSGGLIELDLIALDGFDHLVEWNTIDGNILSDPSDLRISLNQEGWYFVSVTHPLSNCLVLDSIEIISTAEFPFADAGENMTLNCRDSLINLDGSLSEQGGGVTYQWETDDGNIVFGETSLNPMVNAPGVYFLTVINTDNSCSGVDSVVVLEDIESPDFTLSGNTTISCRDAITTLEMEIEQAGNYTSEWYDPSGELIASGDITAFSLSASGEYEIILINNDNFCESSVTVTIDEDFADPIPQIECLECEGCIQLPVVLDANSSQSFSGDHTFSWSTIEGDLEDIGSGRIIVNAEGWYFLEVEDILNGCTAVDSLFIESEKIELPSYQLFPPDCENAKGEIHFGELQDVVSYSIDGGENWEEFPLFNNLDPGFYELVVRGLDVCDSEVVVEELEDNRSTIILSLPSEITVESNGTVNLNLEVLNIDSENLTYEWSPSGLFSCVNCPDPIAGPVTEDTPISVKVNSEGGCEGEISSRLLVSKDSIQIYIPNAFSPNDDGINDRFVVYASQGVDEIHSISIYSRWGELVFSRENFPPNDDNYGWEGTVNGEKAMPGVYMVIVEVEDHDGELKVFSKSINLIR